MNSCYLKLRESIDSLSNSEQKIARYIADNPYEIPSLPIEDLARYCDTSKSSVVRLCKTLGYKGYKDFCMHLNADLVSFSPKDAAYSDILPNDSLRSIAENITQNNIKSLENTLKLLDYNELERAVSAIEQAHRVDFYGCGNSALVALDAQNKFMRIDKVSIAHPDSHFQVVSAANLTPDDVAVLISYSGETRDILDLTSIIAQTGATTISITQYGKNSLCEMVDIKLFTTSMETSLRSGATGSRIGQLNIVDILFFAVASRKYSDIKVYLDRTANAYRKKKM